jgi:hypothetical protein
MIFCRIFFKKHGIRDIIFFILFYFHKMEKIRQKLNKITYLSNGDVNSVLEW